MPFVKDSLSLLIEASAGDILSDTKTSFSEGAVRSGYESIEEASETVVYVPEMIPVVQIESEYYTEMNFLYPYMKTNHIKSISEALNNVAAANNLPECSVGLLIESDCSVDATITKAIESGNQKKKDSTLNKIKDAVNISDKLKKKGIKVKKKKPVVCPECGKTVCECGKKC